MLKFRAPYISPIVACDLQAAGVAVCECLSVVNLISSVYRSASYESVIPSLNKIVRIIKFSHITFARILLDMQLIATFRLRHISAHFGELF